MTTSYRHLLVDRFDDGAIVRITLNRPKQRNAQNRRMLEEIDDAMLAAEADDVARVVILAGAGSMFSSGHDLGSREQLADMEAGPEQLESYRTRGAGRTGAESWMLQEWHYFFTNTLRWRNLRKITVAQVHGPVLAGGLMLMWACDLIVAAEDTEFCDLVGARMGMCGVEYFGHPWEFGPRKAKELLLTGDSMTVDEAYRLGMVSKIFPVDELAERTLAFARRIAATPTVAALLIKEAVNQTVDNMGFYNSLQASFTLHQLNHSHWAQVHDDGFPAARSEDGVPEPASAPPIRPAQRSEAG